MKIGLVYKATVRTSYEKESSIIEGGTFVGNNLYGIIPLINLLYCIDYIVYFNWILVPIFNFLQTAMMRLPHSQVLGYKFCK